MGTLLENLDSPTWWFGVVLVGIAVNFLSSWLMRAQDAFLSRASRKWAARTNRLREQRNARIKELRESSASHQIMLNRSQRNRSLAALQLIMGFQGLIGALLLVHEHALPSIAVLLIGSYLFLAGFRLFFMAEDQYQMLQEASSQES